MPELPEVETVARGLAAVWEGRRLTRLICHRSGLRRPFPEGLSERLAGRMMLRVGRRAKYVLVHFEGGAVLLIHLGMSGRMRIDPPALGKHDHVEFVTEEGRTVAFTDPRRFGALDLCEDGILERHPALAGLGPEPLDDAFTPAVLAARLAGRGGPVKTVLLDQTVVAGLGNIYVCEALFRAGISPLAPAGSLTARPIGRLTKAIRAVLTEAVAAGGTTLRDHARPDGELGYFQQNLAVYGREGQPCPGCTCAEGVRRIMQAGRSTFYCPVRQKT